MGAAARAPRRRFAAGWLITEAARVESLCKELGLPLLVTLPFVEAVDDPSLVSVGRHALRGVATPHEIFTWRV